MFRFLKLYRTIGKDFIKPKFHFYIGSWRREPNLPVWRHGNMIYFAKYKEYESDWSYAKLKDSRWTELGKKNHPILSKIFKPVYQLPIWLSFYFFDNDVMYKTKWTEYDFRFEFLPHITLVLFGYAISITAYIPEDKTVSYKDFCCNDDYWESMLTLDYFKGDLEKTNDQMGYYNDIHVSNFRFCFQPRFLKDPKMQKTLKEIQNEKYRQLLEKENAPDSWDE